MKLDKQSIRRRALDLVAEDGHRVAPRLAGEFGVSRQVANGYLQALVREKLLAAEGTTRARVYTLATLRETEGEYPRDGLQEDVVWRERIAPVVASLADNVRSIWQHASTEMINNAIDHSGSPTVHVRVVHTARSTEVTVRDAGEGIFRKIQRALGLHEPREAILDLAKGKLTTSPENHSGEGIFFTSRMLDAFEIESRGLCFRHTLGVHDSIAEQPGDLPGTRVRMQLVNDSPRTVQEVFDAFTDPQEYTFDKTVVPLRLAQYEGEKLVSRSQARRVAHRFERFKRVELDFSGISEIGQAFADELFRVFAAAHPGIAIVPLHTAPAVDRMIRRVRATNPDNRNPGSM